MSAPTMPDNARKRPAALFESFAEGRFARSYRFDGLQSVVIARTDSEVLPALREVERAVGQGLHAAGYIAYEAATAINPELAVQEKLDLPLVWFGIFAERHPIDPAAEVECDGECRITPPGLEIDQKHYVEAVAAIRGAIAAGETYQVNFTTRQRFRLSGDPFALYRRICRNQRAPFCAWLDIGSHRILSASPELFFALEQDRLTMKPMKGTAARAPHAAADRAAREQLARSAKERAENLMIVDLVRNDLATIAETGSVEVTSLFDIETYPTVHQMTSTVTARIRPETGLSGILRALFPCGSVTGAPKRRTMEIIRDMEQSPRGIYCGAIGYLSPGGEAVFNVAIRTAVIEAATGRGKIGIGSGIIWDSDPRAEYRECLDKGAFLTRDDSEFQLIESLLLDRDGYLLRERHLQRLADSAAYFGFVFNAVAVNNRLDEYARGLSGRHKVRILLTRDGSIALTAQPLGETTPHPAPLPVALSPERVHSNDPFLFHKTTRRTLYEQELAAHPHCADVLFLNERGEVTEGSFNTLVVSLGGELLTPNLECGLLPGVMRAELLAVGAVREAVLTPQDLRRADRLWLVNSVRGWRECTLLTTY